MSEQPSTCIFCDVVAGRAPAYRVHQNEHALVILDINPLAEGHCLVLSKRHTPWWHELSDEESAAVFTAAGVVAKRMMKAQEPDFVCMYARGRRIPHTHVFLVPTIRGDVLDRFFNALEGFQESPQQLVALRDPDTMESLARRLGDTE